MNESWLDEIHWTGDGLVPVIAQQADTGKVVMFAWMNRESLALSQASGYAVYWSRSRQKLWLFFKMVSSPLAYRLAT
jgi:phosphoribosyl-AMP cyclohydrolase